MQKNLDKQLAIQEGRSTYIGKPCKKCGDNVKQVNGGCYSCHKERAKRIQAEKRADGRNVVIRQRYEQGDAGKATRKRYAQGETAANSRWEYSLKQYNITADQYYVMLSEQNNCCSICGVTEEHNNKKLAVDHCHETGKVRALLCHNCNVGLGNFKDNVALMQRAISYLKEHT